MEKVMRHFYLRGLVEGRMGSQTDWNAVDSVMLKALAAAEKVPVIVTHNCPRSSSPAT
jgi:hypothetical protein